MIKDDLEFLVEHYGKRVKSEPSIIDKYWKFKYRLSKYKAQERKWLNQWK